MAVVAPGLMVMAIIYFMGPVSGAHLNPAVTLAFAVRRNFPWKRVPGYILAQLIEAFCGRVSARDVRNDWSTRRDVSRQWRDQRESAADGSGTDCRTGEHDPRNGIRSPNIGTNGAIAVGGYIALAGRWSALISGASMNPVRSLAPDLVRGDLSTTWIYIVGPVAGAMIGVVFEWILKGKPTAAGKIAAEGTLSPDDLES